MSKTVDSEKVSPKRRHYHERVVAAFVEHTTVAEVAKATGLNRRTLQRWRAVPEWWAEVEALRGEVLRGALARLTNALPQVAERLVSVALKPTADDQVVVRAALAVFDTHAGLSQRTELEQRLRAVEEHLRVSVSVRDLPAALRRPTLLVPNPTPAKSG